MERAEISRHEVEVYRALHADPDAWLTNADIGERVRDVSARTVRLHTRRFVGLGLVDQAELFPAHAYRWSPKAKERNRGYLQRLEQAATVLDAKKGAA